MGEKTPVLIVVQGPSPGARYPLPENRVVTVGRSSRNRITLVNPSISRFHCELSFINGRWHLTDLNSKKGTLVNGEKVVGRVSLNPGDIIRLSTIALRFDVIDERAQDEEAIEALRPEDLDGRGARKAEVPSLEDFRLRSRPDSEQRAAREAHTRSMLFVNAVLVGACGLVIACIVGGLLYADYRRVSIQRRRDQARAAQSDSSYKETLGMLEGDSPDRRQAIRKLDELMEEYPGTQAAKAAALKRAEVAWELAETEIEAIGRLEADGQYEEALAKYDALAEVSSERGLTDLIERHRSFALRMSKVEPGRKDTGARN